MIPSQGPPPLWDLACATVLFLVLILVLRVVQEILDGTLEEECRHLHIVWKQIKRLKEDALLCFATFVLGAVLKAIKAAAAAVQEAGMRLGTISGVGSEFTILYTLLHLFGCFNSTSRSFRVPMRCRALWLLTWLGLSTVVQSQKPVVKIAR